MFQTTNQYVYIYIYTYTLYVNHIQSIVHICVLYMLVM